jgi:dihydrofolate reductase
MPEVHRPTFRSQAHADPADGVTASGGRPVVLQISALSLDGRICESGSEFERWADPLVDEERDAWMVDSLWRAGVHIMGGTTFQDMSNWWPTSTEVFADVMNSIPKVGFSHSLTRTTWADSRIVDGDLTQEILALKEDGEGEIIAHGGATFAKALVAADLVDEYRLIVYPFAAARGAALFEAVCPGRPLQLHACTPFPSGCVAMVYRRAGRSVSTPADMDLRRAATEGTRGHQ